ncbi:MAG: exodeoxyribonuclease VII large subunit, partial [Vibrio sp.]|nr:exodeoxyribonuclease VII large subunit [Vibrio sp.]
TIADFVADVRAPTPSAAAELVSRDNSNKRQAFASYQHKLQSAMRYYTSQQAHHLRALVHALEKQHPTYRLQRQSQQLDDTEMRLQRAIQRYISTQREHIGQQYHQLQLHSPVQTLAKQQHRLAKSEQRLLDVMEKKLLRTAHRLTLAAEKLDAVSPLATLKRGYSITRDSSGKVIHRACDLKTGDQLITRVADGEVFSTVN